MSDILDFFKDKKNLFNFLVLGILILGIPIGITLVKQQQIFNSQADVKPVEFVEGKCVVRRNNELVAICPEIEVRLISPLGGPAPSGNIGTQ